MSEAATITKDPRGLLARFGPDTLRQAAQDAVPFTREEPQQTQTEPFKWHLHEGAAGWTGDPGELARLSDPPIIEGLLREREVASVIGAAKTAKTWFALDLALKVSSGESFLGMATHKRKVLYLDYELKDGTFRKRMSLLSPVRPEGFFYQCLRGEARLPRVAEIAALVQAEGFGLVVVDSLYRTGWLTEENNNDSTGRELTALQTFTAAAACTLLCVDHTAKGGGNERSAVDAARGASAKGGFYDCLLVLRPTDKGPDPDGTYCILDPVLRDWPRFRQLPLVSFDWTATACTVALAGEVERGEADASATRILEVIAGAEKGISRAGIVAACNLGETTARRALEALAARNRVIEFPDPGHRQRKLYRLPDIADEPRQTSPNLAT
jgi:hypothetical protein